MYSSLGHRVKLVYGADVHSAGILVAKGLPRCGNWDALECSKSNMNYSRPWDEV